MYPHIGGNEGEGEDTREGEIGTEHPRTGSDDRRARDLLLCSVLEEVQLGYLIGGRDVCAALDSRRDWEAVLSGGEKQRLSMARLYYHNPKFAFLDECTSAVSAEVEELLYAQCQKRHITLVTVSHKPGIRSFHDAELRLGGDGTHSVTAVVDRKT